MVRHTLEILHMYSRMDQAKCKICERKPLKDLKEYSFKFLKGCLPQTLLSPFLNTLSHLISGSTDRAT